MVTGWRRAFCTSVRKERDSKTVLPENQQQKQSGGSCNTGKSPRFGSRFGFFSNPSTPRSQSQQPVSSPSLRCRTTATTTPTSSVSNSPKLQCKTATTPKKQPNNNSPRLFQFSNPSSPKSPSSFSLLKATLRISKQTRCGICLQSVKTGQGTAIFTAECSHSFHFPCVATQIKKNQLLICPVCSAGWKELPLLSVEQQLPETEGKLLKDMLTKPLRVYNDDEPLRSPVSVARFNPIPESETENEDEESEQEFKGFDNTPRFSRQIEVNSRNVEVRLLPEAAAVALSRSYETYVVVLKVKAPPSMAARGTRRPPMDLVTVIDVSGRMSGVRLQMMKRAMRLVISSLRETDRLSIVMFSSSSKRLLPLNRMSSSGRRAARRMIDALGSNGQGMSVNDALKKAAKVLEDRREKNAAATIMLLSDDRHDLAQSNSTNQDFAVVSSTRFPDLEIPVLSVSFRECTHVPSDEALCKVLGPLSVVVQDLRLQLGFLSGSDPGEIASVYSVTARPASLGSDSLRVGDLYSGEERELLLELKVPASSGGAHRVLSVQSSHRDPFTQEVVYAQEQGLLIPRLYAVRSTSPGIGRLRNLHVSTRAVAESRRLVERKDLTGAHHLLSTARALLMQQSNSGSADEFLRGLEAELADVNRRRQQAQIQRPRNNGNCQAAEDKTEPLTPTSAWRAAERLAKVAIMRKHLNRVSDLHGFENARF